MENSQDQQQPRHIVVVSQQDRHLVPTLRHPFSRAGWDVRMVADLPTLVDRQRVPAVLMTVASNEHWRQLERLGRSRTKVAALLADPSPALYRRAFLAGADAVAAASDSPTHVLRALQAAMFDYALVPLAALREGSGQTSVLPGEDQELLRGLAAGLSTEELAVQAGCSQRTIYRRLRKVCSTLQVRSRDEAVAVARRLGLLAVRHAHA